MVSILLLVQLAPAMIYPVGDPLTQNLGTNVVIKQGLEYSYRIPKKDAKGVITYDSMYHMGVDIAGGSNVPVYAIDDGIVISVKREDKYRLLANGSYAKNEANVLVPVIDSHGAVPTVKDFGITEGEEWNKNISYKVQGTGYGNSIFMKHFYPNGKPYYSLYGHMVDGSIPSDIKIGSIIRQGTQIGIIGHTGYCLGPTGIHLHFEIKTKEDVGSGYLEKSVFNVALNDYLKDPLVHIKDNIRKSTIGYFSDGWHEDGTSKAILTGYIESLNEKGAENRFIGVPTDNGGGTWVHPYTINCKKDSKSGTYPQELFIQDFCYNGNCKMLCVLKGKPIAYLHEGCIGCTWWTFNDVLGAPTSNEKKWKETTGYFAGYTVVQHFSLGDVGWKEGSVKIKFTDCLECIDRDNDGCNQCKLSTLSKRAASLSALGLDIDLPSCSEAATLEKPYVNSSFILCESTLKNGDNKIPVKPKTTFSVGENICALLEIKDITKKHRIKIDVLHNDILSWTWGSGEWVNINSETWSSSYGEAIQGTAIEGTYTFKAYVDIGVGYDLIGEVTSIVKNEPVSTTGDEILPVEEVSSPTDPVIVTSSYKYIGYTFCDSVHVAGDQTRTPINPRNTFNEGSNAGCLFVFSDVKTKFRLKVNIYKNKKFSWSWGGETFLNPSNESWSLAYADPIQATTSPGTYQFELLIDTGTGYTAIDTAECAVAGDPTKRRYTYVGSTLCDSISQGPQEYEQIAIRPRTVFNPGDNVFCLVYLSNVSTKFSLMIDVRKDGEPYWTWGKDSFSNTLGDLWSYVYAPVQQTNAEQGTYTFIPRIDTGNGYIALDTVTATVGNVSNVLNMLSRKTPKVSINDVCITISNVSSNVTQIQLYDVSGKLVYKNMVAGTGFISEALPSLPKGVYLVKILSGKYEYAKTHITY
jgi:hypothetical protein